MHTRANFVLIIYPTKPEFMNSDWWQPYEIVYKIWISHSFEHLVETFFPQDYFTLATSTSFESTKSKFNQKLCTKANSWRVNMIFISIFGERARNNIMRTHNVWCLMPSKLFVSIFNPIIIIHLAAYEVNKVNHKPSPTRMWRVSWAHSHEQMIISNFG